MLCSTRPWVVGSPGYSAREISGTTAPALQPLSQPVIPCPLRVSAVPAHPSHRPLTSTRMPWSMWCRRTTPLTTSPGLKASSGFCMRLDLVSAGSVACKDQLAWSGGLRVRNLQATSGGVYNRISSA